MHQRFFLCAFVLALGLTPVYAGDVANFVNLGFSPDSEYFMFGQYGIDQASGKPWAECYVVNNRKNDFVPGGVVKKQYSASLEAGQDPLGAMFDLYGRNINLAKTWHINPLQPGRLLYVFIDGQTPPAQLNFRDFRSGAEFSVDLNQKSQGVAANAVSSFSLALRVQTRDGKKYSLVAGNPGVQRLGVESYKIRRIVFAPDEKTLVFLMEKTGDEKGTSGLRYMVETVKLP